MPRGQTSGWKLLRNVPKETPPKPVRVSTGIWFTQHRTFAAYVYLHGKSVFIGSYPTVQEAEDARQERLQEGKKGTALVARSKSRLRLNDLKELYFSETAADWKESTRRAALARSTRSMIGSNTLIRTCWSRSWAGRLSGREAAVAMSAVHGRLTTRATSIP